MRLRLLAFVLLPLTLTACSGNSSHARSSRPPTSPLASALPRSTAPVGKPTSYVVTAGKGVSDRDLRHAVSSLGKLPGVIGVGMVGNHKLRVDLHATADEQADVLASLRKLGSVSPV